MTEEKRPTLLISIPVPPHGNMVAHLTHFLLAAWQHHYKDWDIKIDIVPHKPVAAARNMQVRRFLWDPDLDHRDVFLTIDADAVPNLEGMEWMLEHIQRDDIDCINGLALMNTNGGPMPVCQKYVGEGTVIYDEILMKDPDDGPYELINGGVGAAALMITREGLLKLYDAGRIWFKDTIRDASMEHHVLVEGIKQCKGHPEQFYEQVKNWVENIDHLDKHHVGSRHLGQDVWFFKMCHDVGVRCWVDTRIFWGHVKSVDMMREFRETQKLMQRIHQLEGEDALKERQEKLAEDVKAMDKIEKYVKEKEQPLVVLPGQA